MSATPELRDARGVSETIGYIRDGEPTATMLDALRDACAPHAVVPVAELSDHERGALRVAVVDGPDRAELAALPSLEVVFSTWAGVESLLAQVPNGVHIVRMVDPGLAASMSEAVLTWVLYLHRDGPCYARQQRARQWAEHVPIPAGRRRVSVLGLGQLGVAAAQTLRQHGFDVAGWSRSARTLDGVTTFSGSDGLNDCLQRSDIVVNLLPHTPSTAGLLGEQAFAQLPDNASVINVGRGATIDEELLLDALDARLEHAVLDVFHTEPLPAEHPFWGRDDVTVLPHVAAWTSPDTAAPIIGAHVLQYVADGSLPADALVDRSRGY